MTSILGNEWHISSAGGDILTENDSNKNKQQVYNLALNTDLKEICKPVIHEFNNEASKIILQIHKIRNISAPKANEESQAAPRMFKLTLTDGEAFIQALEISHLGNINWKNTPPGTKLLLEKVKIVNGYLMLSSQNCKVLGGKVPSLIEKWELTKSVQRNRRNNDNDDGPPPWVNFGTKIKTGNQEGNFKSLTDKPKDSKEASEFDQQRKDAIAEASSGAVRKVFSGRVKQNVEVQNVNNKIRQPREKKEVVKSKGKTLIKEHDEKPLKPSDKVSLFAFLEDKLPVTGVQDNFYQTQPSKNVFKEIESFNEDQSKYDYKRKKAPVPKQFEKPDYNKYQAKNKSETSKKETITGKVFGTYDGDSFNKINNNQFFNVDRENENKKSNYHSQKSNSYGQNQPQNSNFTTNDQYKQKFQPQPKNNAYSQQNDPYPQQNNSYSQQHTSYRPQSNPYPSQNNLYSQQNNTYPQPTKNYPQHNDYYPPQNTPYSPQSNNQNLNNFPKQPYQRQNVPSDLGRITQEVQRMALNSQFATRSLRQHLNLNGGRKSEEGPGKSHETGSESGMNVGDEIMAKYWEDGKFYNATIISITEKTFAVKFKGYGNIEEILKSDCQPLFHSNNNKPNFNQQHDRSNRQFSGSGEYRRRNFK